MFIRDCAAHPPPNFIAKDPEPSGTTQSDRSLGDDSASLPVLVGDGCHLDDHASFGNLEDKCRVVEVAWLAALPSRQERLERLSARAYNHLTGAKWDPQDVNLGG